MGIYAGLAPDKRTIALLREHGASGVWAVSYDEKIRMLHDIYRARPLAASQFLRYYGMDVLVDDTLPAGTIELRNNMGETLGRIENVSQQNTNKQTPRPPFDPPSQTMPSDTQWEQLKAEYAKWEAANPNATSALFQAIPTITGPTTRLETRCKRCSDALPAGAVFCIACGEKV